MAARLDLIPPARQKPFRTKIDITSVLCLLAARLRWGDVVQVLLWGLAHPPQGAPDKDGIDFIRIKRRLKKKQIFSNRRHL